MSGDGGGFRQLEEDVVHEGPVVTLVSGQFSAPDGSRFERQIVRHPGAVAVVPVTDDRAALLVRQFRAAIGRELLEIPAGKRDVPGEDPAVTAARELAEEVGVRAGRLDELARFYNSPGFSDELSICYMARGLEDCGTDLQGVEEVHMTVVAVPLDDVPALIAAGDIMDAKTIIGLALAADRLAAGR
ncbi:MAG TPA: NUDIX hydrolase [Acidimicrobiales bacterium]|nr:NUDIX hydrolase [Acidimicrobiales bacterium]